MGKLNVHFALHNNNIEVYARNPLTRQQKFKSLRFFWGNEKKLRTDISIDATQQWDSKKRRLVTEIQIFGKTHELPDAIEDNKKLEALEKTIQHIIDTVDPSTPDQLFEAYQATQKIENSRHITLLEYTIYYRNLWKENKIKGFEKESGNYVAYDKLIHKLQGTYKGKQATWHKEAERFAKTPIYSITSADFRSWALFLKKHQLCFDETKTFRSVCYYFHRHDLGDLDYHFDSIKDIEPVVSKRKVVTLSRKELNDLLTFDVNRIWENSRLNKELLKDTAILMLGTLSRPCDVVGMRIEDLKYDAVNDSFEWNYCAQKLINRAEKAAIGFANPTGVAIIKKYMGNRTSGFLLPHFCNRTDKGWQRRKAAVNHVTSDICKFLQDMARVCHWETKHPTMYTLRKTSITNAISKGSISEIAVYAKTSSREIQSVYMNRSVVGVNVGQKLADIF